MPLYQQLHGYVRYKLNQYYGNEIVDPHGNIPMHLLGNIWAQQWHEIYDILLPYQNEQFTNITESLVNQNYTAIKLFQLGDDFFKSLGMIPLPESFYKLSLMERPQNATADCHSGAWNFGNNDVRVKMCTKVNAQYLYSVHHELGHIQYYLQTSSNVPHPGFHEAIGDVIDLSVRSTRHLHRIGLTPLAKLNHNQRINNLFYMVNIIYHGILHFFLSYS